MEVYEKNEIFVEEDGDLEFSHTKVIFRKGDTFFYGRSRRRLFPGSAFDFSPSELTEIPLDNIWPKVNQKLTEAPSPLPPNCYVKKARLIEYGDNEASRNPGALLLSEAKICEVLALSPHPNIAQYLGCILEDGRLKGLCFTNYPKTLHQAVQDPNPALDVERCMDGITYGLEHLHRLGLIHNDLNPWNIMMDGGIPIIIDFDSCRLQDSELGIKGGTSGWNSCDTKYAERGNDINALPKIRNFLEEKAGRKENMIPLPHV